MKVSPQMLLIFAECEIVNEYGDIKSLEELTLPDLRDIWTCLDSDENTKLENSSEFMEISPPDPKKCTRVALSNLYVQNLLAPLRFPHHLEASHLYA